MKISISFKIRKSERENWHLKKISSVTAPLPVGEGKEEGANMETSGVVKLQYLSDGKLRQARELRKNMTDAEDILWQRLRRNQLGVKFRRQQIIEGFIVDFFCESAKLVVEVDYSIHDSIEQKAYDEHRRYVFEARGLREVRFKNDQVIKDIENVIRSIQSFPPLSPYGREAGREVKGEKK